MLYFCCTAVLDVLMQRNINIITMIILIILVIINTSQNMDRVCKLSAVINE